MAREARMKAWDVSIVGELFIDHIMSGFEVWPGPGEEVSAQAYAREIGGGAANTACGLARLGHSVNLIGAIGVEDAPWFCERLAAFGVGAQGLVRAPGTTGITLSVSTRQDRSFFTHRGVNAQLTQLLGAPEVIDHLASARHVHFAMPLAAERAGKLLPLLAEAGCTTSLDVGFEPDWLRDPVNHWTCQSVTWLLPNQKEAELISGGPTPEDFFAFADRLALDACLLKLGAQGAMGRAGGLSRAVTPPRVEVVDTTGAGDAFNAGFIDALLAGAGLEDSLRRACICGALSTRAAGALAGLPHPDDLWSTHEQTYGS